MSSGFFVSFLPRRLDLRLSRTVLSISRLDSVTHDS